MAVDPSKLKRFTSDGEVHDVVKARHDEPVLTRAGFYRVTCKCGRTVDCAPEEFEDTLRFSTTGQPQVTCLTCIAA